MEAQYGLSAEIYQAVIAVVDDRMQQITIVRQDFDRLGERQTRLEGRMDRVEAALERLAEAQARTEERVTRLEAAVERLAEAQARTEEELRKLVVAFNESQRIQKGILNQLAQLTGNSLEIRYRERAGTYWGKVLRKVKAYLSAEMEEILESRLTSAEYDDFLNLDLVVHGRLKEAKEDGEIWLAIEVSSTIDRRDVERAVLRAGYLRKAGYRALPAVAGEKVTQGAETVAEAQQVVINLNGQLTHWEEALARSVA